MTIDRRTFIVGTGVTAIAPTLELWPPQLEAGDAGRVVFMIEGWSADGGAHPDRVWIKLDRSWRTAWR
jgi:hypothetical protein